MVWLLGEHGHDMTGHEMVNGDLTGYTIHDTTTGTAIFLAFTLIYPCKIESTLFTFLKRALLFPLGSFTRRLVDSAPILTSTVST